MSEFDDIRCYYDQDVEPAIKRLLGEPFFINAVQFLHPEWKEEAIKSEFSKIKSIRQFQESVIYSTVNSVLKNTTTGFTQTGLESIPKDKPCLYISNHRDIVLDSAFLNITLFKHGFDTTKIAIGDNLLIYPWIEDLVKLNRSFVVKRGLSRMDKIIASRRLSAYLRHSIVNEKTSVWIAQREGRAKDGDDRTHPGLLKMIASSGSGAFYEDFRELAIVPLAVSYEYDPCDALKTKELLERANHTYTKKPEHDLNSMYMGIMGMKGRVHFSFGGALDEEIKAIAEMAPKNDQFDVLADLLDHHIHTAYHLWPSNYAAYDLLTGGESQAANYTDAELNFFKDYMNEKLNAAQVYGPEAVRIFLEMYANPVKNQLAQKEQG